MNKRVFRGLAVVFVVLYSNAYVAGCQPPTVSSPARSLGFVKTDGILRAEASCGANLTDGPGEVQDGDDDSVVGLAFSTFVNVFCNHSINHESGTASGNVSVVSLAAHPASPPPTPMMPAIVIPGDALLTGSIESLSLVATPSEEGNNAASSEVDAVGLYNVRRAATSHSDADNAEIYEVDAVGTPTAFGLNRFGTLKAIATFVVSGGPLEHACGGEGFGCNQQVTCGDTNLGLVYLGEGVFSVSGTVGVSNECSDRNGSLFRNYFVTFMGGVNHTVIAQQRIALNTAVPVAENGDFVSEGQEYDILDNGEQIGAAATFEMSSEFCVRGTGDASLWTCSTNLNFFANDVVVDDTFVPPFTSPFTAPFDPTGSPTQLAINPASPCDDPLDPNIFDPTDPIIVTLFGGAPGGPESEEIGRTTGPRPDILDELGLSFADDVNIGTNDLLLTNETTGGGPVDVTGVGFSYVVNSVTGSGEAKWNFDNLQTPLAPGFYRAQLTPAAATLGELDETIYVALPGDLNLDGKVDILGDGITLINNLGIDFGATWADGDFNGDGKVDVLGDAFIFNFYLGSDVRP